MGYLLRSTRAALFLGAMIGCGSGPGLANSGDTYLQFYAADTDLSQASPFGRLCAFRVISIQG